MACIAPAILGRAASEAVIDWTPAVLKVAKNVCLPPSTDVKV